MPIEGFEVAKAAAGLVASYVGNQQQASALAAEVAALLDQNNAIILAGVANLLKASFSQAKLDQCNNKAKTIATFMGEYNVNPADQSKLVAVDQMSGELLDVLDDPDIAVAGIANWMIAASIRLLALQTKSSIFPADLTNAKNRATDYSAYVATMKPKVASAIEARFGPVTNFGVPPPGTIVIGDVPYGWAYSVDGVAVSNFQNEGQANNSRTAKIHENVDPQMAAMQEAIDKWTAFANA